MPPQSSPPEHLIDSPFLDLWLGQIRRWQRRLPEGRNLGAPEDLLEQLQGPLWLQAGAWPVTREGASRALRSALYQEFESPWRRSRREHPLELDILQPEARQTAPIEIPEHLQGLVAAYLRGQGPEGNLTRAMAEFGSRRMVRHLNALLLSYLTHGHPLRDLKRRCGRLFAAATRDGAMPCHRREARSLRRALRMLPPDPEIHTLQQGLNGIAEL